MVVLPVLQQVRFIGPGEGFSSGDGLQLVQDPEVLLEDLHTLSVFLGTNRFL